MSVRRSAIPNLRDSGESGPVKTGFDPNCFEWHDDIPDRFCQKEMAIVITPREIRVLAGAGERFLNLAERGADGFYRASIGIAPKAVAIKPLQPGIKGLRVRKCPKSTALYISCKKLIQRLGWPLPVRLLATWDAEHGMLVGRLAE